MNVAAIQRFYRRFQVDEFSGEKSFMYGRSTSNQRIEAWWGILRKSCTDWWIRYFKDLRDMGLYNDDGEFERECLKFCFMQVIQKELNVIARNWNLHRIRPSNNAESPSGIPDVRYFNPLSAEVENYSVPVSQEDHDIASTMFTRKPEEHGCAPEFKDLMDIIMEEEDLQMPSNASEAKNLYTTLLHHIVELNNDNDFT